MPCSRQGGDSVGGMGSASGHLSDACSRVAREHGARNSTLMRIEPGKSFTHRRHAHQASFEWAIRVLSDCPNPRPRQQLRAHRPSLNRLEQGTHSALRGLEIPNGLRLRVVPRSPEDPWILVRSASVAHRGDARSALGKLASRGTRCSRRSCQIRRTSAPSRNSASVCL